jgi:hypothetical protein
MTKDDVVLIADSEENIQTLLLRFDQMAERLNFGNISK